MMKTKVSLLQFLRRALLLAVLFAGGTALHAQQTITRFAVVDMARVNAVLGVSAGPREFAAKSAAVQEEINRLGGELAALNAELETARAEKTRGRVQALEEQVKTKTREIQEYIRKSFAELEQEKTRLSQNDGAVTRLHAVLKAVAEKEGYSMILSKQESSGILWYSPSVDITGKVIEYLRGRR